MNHRLILTVAAAASCIFATATNAVPITVIDLTPGIPASGGPLNGGFVFAIDPQSTGTGVIDPFLREQNNGSEQGINTSIASPPLDDKAGIWTHDLLVSSLGQVTYQGLAYDQFILDANQINNGPISLRQFKIYVTSGAPFTASGDLTTLISSGTPVYDMNGGATQYRVDIASQNGSGSGDMSFLVPASLIGTSGNLYLYAEFGPDANGAGFQSNDGIEEWSALTGTPQVNAPDAGTTLTLLGLSLTGIAVLRRKFNTA